MTRLDWILLGFVGLSALGGLRRGLIGTALGLAGLAVGSVVGARAAPHFLGATANAHYGALVGLGGAAVGAVVFEVAASLVASLLRTGLRLLPPLRMLDSLGGAVAGALFGVVLIWVVGAVALQIPGQPKVRREVKQSHVLRRLDRIAPPHDILHVQTQLGSFTPF
jgi:membrane protein required for colicin V production